MITGASNGLGAEMARQVATQGAHTILTARRTEKLAELSTQIQADYGVISAYYKMDMTNFVEVEEVVQRLVIRKLMF